MMPEGGRQGGCVRILYFTDRGGRLAERIGEGLAGAGADVRREDGRGRLAELTEEYFRSGVLLLFIGAAGIAVRAIAPHITKKDRDPAVLVCDEYGQHVISLLSGHIGGANAWARRVAGITGGTAVITTATDLNRLFSVDEFARFNGFAIEGLSQAKRFSADLLQTERARLLIPGELADCIAFRDEQPAELELVYACGGDRFETLPEVWLTPYRKREPSDFSLVPPMLVAGIGCRRGKSAEELRRFYDRVLQEHGLHPSAVCALATVDVKKDEAGLLSLAGELHLPLAVYAAEELAAQPGAFSDSDFVKRTIGVGNVCERAAAAGGAVRMLVTKQAEDGMTMAVGVRRVEASFSYRGKL